MSPRISARGVGAGARGRADAGATCPAEAPAILGLMKLVLAVIQDADATALVRTLSEHAFEVTKLASTGGFLREGNTTLMIGVDDDRLPELKRHVQRTCRARTRLVSPNVPMGEQNESLMGDPVEVPVGGAVMFVMGVQEFIKV